MFGLFFQVFVVLSLMTAPTQAVPMEKSSETHEHSQVMEHHDHHEVSLTVSTKNLDCCHSVDTSHSCHLQFAASLIGSFSSLFQPMKGQAAYFSNVKGPKSKGFKPPDRPPIS
jgi:hypothetical protein